MAVRIEISAFSVKALKFNVPKAHVEHFEVGNGQSGARLNLLEALAAVSLSQRPDWDVDTINQAFTITILDMGLQYVLAADEEQESEQSIVLFADEEQGSKQSTVASPQSKQVPSGSSLQQTKRKGIRWNNKMMLRLIYEWTVRRQRFANNIERNECIWEDLAEALVAEGLEEVTGSQCENKFKYIKKTYTETKDQNKKSTGQPQHTCPYYEEMDEIFGKSPQISPPFLGSNRDGIQNTQPTNESLAAVTNVAEEENPDTQPPRKKTRLESTASKWAETFQEKILEKEMNRQKRHEEMLSMQKESNEIFKNIMNKLLEKM